jgi:hypothetical protein
MIRRSETDSILAEQLGLRKDIPRRMFQQLIAKASDDVKRKLGWERPDLVGQIETSVADVAGALQSKFGPASKCYFNAKKIVVASQHQYGNLNESSILEYARSRKFEEATVGLSLLCSLPVDVVERALADNNNETTLILAKALKFDGDYDVVTVSWRNKSSHLCTRLGWHERGVRAFQHRNLSECSEFL